MILSLPHRHGYVGMRLFVELPDRMYTIDAARVVAEVEVPDVCKVSGRYLMGNNQVDILIRPELLYEGKLTNMANAGADPAETEPEPNAGQADEVTEDVGEADSGGADEDQASEAEEADTSGDSQRAG